MDGRSHEDVACHVYISHVMNAIRRVIPGAESNTGWRQDAHVDAAHLLGAQ